MMPSEEIKQRAEAIAEERWKHGIYPAIVTNSDDWQALMEYLDEKG